MICGVDEPRVAHTNPTSTHPAAVVTAVGVEGLAVDTVDVFELNAFTIAVRDTPRYTTTKHAIRTFVDCVSVTVFPESAAVRFCTDHTCDW